MARPVGRPRRLGHGAAALALLTTVAALAAPASASASASASGAVDAPEAVSASAAAPSRPWTVAWSVAPATIGIVELAGDRALGRKTLVRLVVALGRGSTRLWSTRQVRGLTMIEDQWLAQIGAQLRRSLVGDVARGLFVAGDLRLLSIPRPVQPVLGAGVGVVCGARWTFAGGLTLELGGGGGLVVSSLVQRGTERRVASFSAQGQGTALIGWSF